MTIRENPSEFYKPNFDTKFEEDCQIRDYSDWRAPYIGRIANDKFWEIFEDKIIDSDECDNVLAGRHIFESITKEPNIYDSSTRTHSLTVYFSALKESDKNKPIARRRGNRPSTYGLITKIVGCLHTHTFTTSNWQDHAESRDSFYCVKDAESIKQYKEILDSCTEETGQDYVFRLFQYIKKIDSRYSDKPIYKIQDGWLFNSVTSHELMTTLLYARSYLELFLSIHYLVEMPTFANIFGYKKIDENEMMIDWQRCSILKRHLDNVMEMLGYIDLRFFYQGFDDFEYTESKRRAIDRLVARCGIAQHLFGLPNIVIRSSIQAAINEKLSNGARKYHSDFIQVQKPNLCGMTIDSIPLDSYLFFSDVMDYLGYAREDGSVYIKESYGKHKFIGTMEDDGSVFNASGVCVCKIEDNIGICRAKRYHENSYGKKYYGLWMDETGLVLGDAEQGKVRYLGEAYVWKQAMDFGSQPYITLTRIKKKPNNFNDKRLGGIALLGYLPLNEICDIVDECNKSKQPQRKKFL